MVVVSLLHSGLLRLQAAVEQELGDAASGVDLLHDLLVDLVKSTSQPPPIATDAAPR